MSLPDEPLRTFMVTAKVQLRVMAPTMPVAQARADRLLLGALRALDTQPGLAGEGFTIEDVSEVAS